MIPAVVSDQASSTIPFLSPREESSAQRSIAPEPRDSPAVESIDEYFAVEEEETAKQIEKGTPDGTDDAVVSLPPPPPIMATGEIKPVAAGDSNARPAAPATVQPRIVRVVAEAETNHQNVPAVIKNMNTPDKLIGNKPPRVRVNIEWVRKGPGWDCREVYYVGDKRRRKHIGHIGRQKWEEMQEKYQGEALQETLRAWIEARRSEKSIA